MPTDAALLTQYSDDRDAEAFAELVRRHAAMVYGTSLRILGDPHDAEDVAQECFLALARKFHVVASSPAGWLHSTATGRALNAVRDAATRRRHEERAMQENLEGGPEPTWQDIAPGVDQALEELPDELRVPVVLHYLEGRTQAEVSQELGVNQSTVSRRLEKGVDELREKLRRAGVVVSVSLLATLLTGNAASAAVPATLTASLVKVGLAGVGKGAVATAGSAAAVVLTLKIAAVVAVGTVAVGGVVACMTATSTGKALPTQRPSGLPKRNAEPKAAEQEKVDGPASEKAAALKEFGVETCEPIDAGFLFLDYQYVAAPYTLERRGLDIFVNGRLLSPGPTWPPYDYTVKTDPGAPPEGLSPVDDPPEGQDPRDSYWSRKSRYLMQNLPCEQARTEMMKLYVQSGAFREVARAPAFPDKLNVKDIDGFEYTISLGPARRGPPPTREELLRVARGHLKLYEQSLSRSGVMVEMSGGGSLTLNGRRSRSVLRALTEEISPDERMKMLEASLFLEFAKAEDRDRLRNFTPSPEFSRRVAENMRPAESSSDGDAREGR